MNLIGKPPIQAGLLVLGKVAFAVSMGFVPLQLTGITRVSTLPRALEKPALALFTLSLLVFVLSIIHLGRSIRVGLPEEKTELKTDGMYRFSRNPIYLSMLFMCVASSLYAIHPVNAVCALLSILVHHRIILAEEKFLATAFGVKWAEYSRRVRRYL